MNMFMTEDPVILMMIIEIIFLLSCKFILRLIMFCFNIFWCDLNDLYLDYGTENIKNYLENKRFKF